MVYCTAIFPHPYPSMKMNIKLAASLSFPYHYHSVFQPTKRIYIVSTRFHVNSDFSKVNLYRKKLSVQFHFHFQYFTSIFIFEIGKELSELFAILLSIYFAFCAELAFAPHALLLLQSKIYCPCLLTRMTPTTLVAIVPRLQAATGASLLGLRGTETGTMQTTAMKTTTIHDAATTAALRPR